MFKLTIKHQNDVDDVVLTFSLLISNNFIPFSSVSIVDFEQVNLTWEKRLSATKLLVFYYLYLKPTYSFSCICNLYWQAVAILKVSVAKNKLQQGLHAKLQVNFEQNSFVVFTYLLMSLNIFLPTAFKEVTQKLQKVLQSDYTQKKLLTSEL